MRRFRLGRCRKRIAPRLRPGLRQRLRRWQWRHWWGWCGIRLQGCSLLLTRHGGEKKPGWMITTHGLPPEHLRRLTGRNLSQDILPALSWGVLQEYWCPLPGLLSPVFRTSASKHEFRKHNNEGLLARQTWVQALEPRAITTRPLSLPKSKPRPPNTVHLYISGV